MWETHERERPHGALGLKAPQQLLNAPFDSNLWGLFMMMCCTTYSVLFSSTDLQSRFSRQLSEVCTDTALLIPSQMWLSTPLGLSLGWCSPLSPPPPPPFCSLPLSLCYLFTSFRLSFFLPCFPFPCLCHFVHMLLISLLLPLPPPFFCVVSFLSFRLSQQSPES